MKIVIDICHPCDINFFKNAIHAIQDNERFDINIIALNRDPIPKIIQDELANFNTTYIGKHRHTFFSMIFEANVFRFFRMLSYLKNLQPELGLSFGSFILGSSLKLLGKKNIQFYDDPENKKNVYLQKKTADELYFPFFYTANNVKNFKGLKEWAHLSPKYFLPNANVLLKYNIIQKKYIFVREVNTKTTNYLKQKNNLIASISDNFPADYKVIFSLEDKAKRNLYPSSWINIIEPESGIHSLLFYSKIVISSGDSFAREGAVLGVPSIYCGTRKMAANKVMEKKNILFHVNTKNIPSFLTQIISNEILIQDQDIFRAKLEEEWDDVTEFILSAIKKKLNANITGIQVK